MSLDGNWYYYSYTATSIFISKICNIKMLHFCLFLQLGAVRGPGLRPPLPGPGQDPETRRAVQRGPGQLLHPHVAGEPPGTLEWTHAEGRHRVSGDFSSGMFNFSKYCDFLDLHQELMCLDINNRHTVGFPVRKYSGYVTTLFSLEFLLLCIMYMLFKCTSCPSSSVYVYYTQFTTLDMHAYELQFVFPTLPKSHSADFSAA